jgi:hypothetical protein
VICPKASRRLRTDVRLVLIQGTELTRSIARYNISVGAGNLVDDKLNSGRP